MEKIDKKILFLVLVFTISITFFIVTNIYLPLARGIGEYSQRVKENKERVRLIRAAFSDPAKIARIKKEAGGLLDFIKAQIPIEDSTTQLVKLLRRPPTGIEMSIDSISPGRAQELKEYFADSARQVSYLGVPVNISATGTTKGLLQYLVWLNEQERLVSVRRLTITRGLEEGAQMKAQIELWGYAFGPQGPPAGAPKETAFLDENYIARVLEKPPAEKIDLTSEPVKEIFGELKPHAVPQAAGAAPQSTLTLSGVVFKANKASAIINGKLAKENEIVEGFRVIKIKEDSVVLEKNGREIVLPIKK